MSAETPGSEFRGRRTSVMNRPRGASDTIAGQYAEASRLRGSRAGLRRLPVGIDPNPSYAPGYTYDADSPRRPRTDASFLPSRAELESEIDKLRARVTELESTRPQRGGLPSYFPSPQWPRPSVCATRTSCACWS